MLNGELGNRETVNCELVWREISNYVEGDVDAGLRLGMDEHFRTCARCSSVLEGTRNVIRLYGDERMMEVPAGFGRRLERRLEKRLAPPKNRWLTLEAWLVPLAALALITGTLQLANSFGTQRTLKSQMEQAGKNIPPDMIVLVSAHSKVFHIAGCPFIHGKGKDQLRTLTAKEALREGYAPCTRCLRKYLVASAGGNSLLNSQLADADDDDDDDAPGGGQ